MYPYIRAAYHLTSAHFKSPLLFDESSKLHLRASLTDVDMLGVVNNGRQMTLMDLGRIDIVTRTKLSKLILKNRWNMVIGGTHITYKKPIPFFSKFELVSKVIGIDEKWFYLQQELHNEKGELCTIAIVKGGLTKHGNLIEPASALLALGLQKSTISPIDNELANTFFAQQTSPLLN